MLSTVETKECLLILNSVECIDKLSENIYSNTRKFFFFTNKNTDSHVLFHRGVRVRISFIKNCDTRINLSQKGLL